MYHNMLSFCVKVDPSFLTPFLPFPFLPHMNMMQCLKNVLHSSDVNKRYKRTENDYCNFPSMFCKF